MQYPQLNVLWLCVAKRSSETTIIFCSPLNKLSPNQYPVEQKSYYAGREVVPMNRENPLIRRDMQYPQLNVLWLCVAKRSSE
ncbi:MAG: hypothetical protein R6U84_09010, partial [Candidatus Cloacimonadales bacterium]